jgi:hypothetical protein
MVGAKKHGHGRTWVKVNGALASRGPLAANAPWSDRLPRLLPSRRLEAPENAGRARPRFAWRSQLEIAAKWKPTAADRFWRLACLCRRSGPIGFVLNAVAAVDQAFHRVATAAASWGKENPRNRCAKQSAA